jgi:hypothetical protein
MKGGLAKEVGMVTQRLRAVLWAVIGLSASACASSRTPMKPPFPTDPDPCASYCLVWVPPEYREVPRVVPCEGKIVTEKVCRSRVELEETCTPGHYEARRSPDVCRQWAIVEAEPARTEWRTVKCCDEKNGCCYKPVEIPAQYKVCERRETEKGIEYCAFTPPEYDVKPVVKHDALSVPHYVPGEAKVVYDKQLFAEGHWEWKVKYCGCQPPKKDCPKPPVCAPQPPAGGCGCGAPATPPRQGDFSYAPAAN